MGLGLVVIIVSQSWFPSSRILMAEGWLPFHERVVSVVVSVMWDSCFSWNPGDHRYKTMTGDFWG